jgi:LPS sulfotransferase NodH
MGWQNWCVRFFSPGYLTGVSFGDWVWLLFDNGFRVSPRFWPKAAWTSLLLLGNSPLRWLEAALYGRRVAARKVLPPVIVLGHARSGTTHLQNLLAVDSRLASPTVVDASHPHDFLLTAGLRSKVQRWFMPSTRGVDNVAWQPQAPAEEEPALCSMTFLSPLMSLVFPTRAEHYDRYVTFRNVPPREVKRWKAAFVKLARKLTLKYQRPLLFKSPAHIGRIKLLLDIFPDARFVHIHRNPYAVYQSTRRMRALTSTLFPFQTPDPTQLHGRILRQYAEMYEAFFEERGLIPAGRYTEVGFEDLEKDPVGQVRRIYEELSLPDFAVVEPALRSYVGSLAGYQKNEHANLPADVRADVARAWRRSFEEWNYPL